MPASCGSSHDASRQLNVASALCDRAPRRERLLGEVANQQVHLLSCQNNRLMFVMATTTFFVCRRHRDPRSLPTQRNKDCQHKSYPLSRSLRPESASPNRSRSNRTPAPAGRVLPDRPPERALLTRRTTTLPERAAALAAPGAHRRRTGTALPRSVPPACSFPTSSY